MCWIKEVATGRRETDSVVALSRVLARAGDLHLEMGKSTQVLLEIMDSEWKVRGQGAA